MTSEGEFTLKPEFFRLVRGTFRSPLTGVLYGVISSIISDSFGLHPSNFVRGDFLTCPDVSGGCGKRRISGAKVNLFTMPYL